MKTFDFSYIDYRARFNCFVVGILLLGVMGLISCKEKSVQEKSAELVEEPTDSQVSKDSEVSTEQASPVTCMEVCTKHYTICDNRESCTRDCESFGATYNIENCGNWIDEYNACMMGVAKEDWNCTNSVWIAVIVDACRDESTSLFMCKRTEGEPCVAAAENDSLCENAGKPPHYHFCINDELAHEGCVTALTGYSNGAYCCP